ncbi:MAG: flagellar assembly protein FliW [Bacillus sp. (in: Bacteria)]|uniref:Flagellar assembly factor FliW n=1 Tax=Niallia alba TaxID=2729105 RepID=A0A7Y0KCM5_9BACI|nr:flagellar assembly protein FliW [Niallia alba]MBQ6448684.1 flagellar assembly protein FliW [Bacillus sp. (in: firmicutes)]NMO79245.1 flagellar assembly protein FliW [Niallia alba]
MKIATKYHGEKEIQEKEVITFPQAIPGFPEEKEFVLLPLDEESQFIVLQSVENQQLAFVLSNPFTFFKEYEFTLEDHIVELLELESEEDIQVFSILTVQDQFEKTTANLQAPVVINSKKNIAKQVILNEPNYHTKHPLFQKNNPTLVKG